VNYERNKKGTHFFGTQCTLYVTHLVQLQMYASPVPTYYVAIR